MNVTIKFIILFFLFILTFKEVKANGLDIEVYVRKTAVSGINNNKINIYFNDVFNCLINSSQFRNQFSSLGIVNNFNDLYRKQGIKNINFYIRKILLEYFDNNKFILNSPIGFTCNDSDTYNVKSSYDIKGRSLERITILLIPNMLIKQFPRIKIPDRLGSTEENTLYYQPWENTLNDFYKLFTIKFLDLKNKYDQENNNVQKKDIVDYKKIHKALNSGQLNDQLYIQGLFINFNPSSIYDTLNYCFLETDDVLKFHTIMGYINLKEKVLFDEIKIAIMREKEGVTGKVPYGFFSNDIFNNPNIKNIKNLDTIASKIDHCNIFVGRNSEIKKLKDYISNSNKHRGYHKISEFHGKPIENKILLDYFGQIEGFDDYHQFTLNRVFNYSVEELQILQKHNLYNIVDLEGFAKKTDQIDNYNKGIKIPTDFIEGYFNPSFKPNKNLEEERKKYLEKILNK